MKRSLLFVLSLSLLFVESVCHSQTVSLVLTLDEIIIGQPVTYTDAIYNAEINLQEMRELPESLEILLVDGDSITVERTLYAARDGYEYNDPPLPPFTVLPGASLTDMAYHWVGSSDNRANEVSITVVGSRLHASIWSGGRKYIIEPGSIEFSHRMFELNGCIRCPPPQSVNNLDIWSLIILILLAFMFGLRATKKIL